MRTQRTKTRNIVLNLHALKDDTPIPFQLVAKVLPIQKVQRISVQDHILHKFLRQLKISWFSSLTSQSNSDRTQSISIITLSRSVIIQCRSVTTQLISIIILSRSITIQLRSITRTTHLSHHPFHFDHQLVLSQSPVYSS